MKTKILFITALAIGLLLASCSSDKDNSMTVNKTYRMYVGQGSISKTGSEAPAITALENAVTVSVAPINTGLTEINVKGKGKNEEEALADAKQQAIAVYETRAAVILPQLAEIKTKFEEARKAAAGAILDETGYYTKLTLQLFLVEKTGDFQDPIIKESASYYMEAIGGDDYSN